MITRMISGIVGIGISAYVIQRGGTTFSIAAAVLAVLAWFEFTRAFSRRGGNPALFSGLLGIGGMLYGAYTGQLDMILLAVTASSLLALLTSPESVTSDSRLPTSSCCAIFRAVRM